MRFEFRNIGELKYADFQLNQLTLVCGKNNTCKTYLLNAVYTAYTFIQRSALIDKFDVKTKNESEIVDYIQEVIHKLPDNFIEYYRFLWKFQIDGSVKLINKDSYINELKSKNKNDLLRKLQNSQALIISSFRSGIAQFYSSLNNEAMRLASMTNSDNINNENNFFPFGVYSNVMLINSAIPLENNKSYELNGVAKDILPFLEELIGGKLEITLLGMILFTPKGSDKKLNLNEASSSVASLAILYFVIKYFMFRDKILVIDEPELNLHPHNQRLMARLLVRLANAGVRVLVSTHSDYIVRELNAMIMIHKNPTDGLKIAKQYDAQDIINPEHVSMYYTNSNGEYVDVKGKKQKGLILEKAEIDELGISAMSFKDDLKEINGLHRELYKEIFLKDE